MTKPAIILFAAAAALGAAGTWSEPAEITHDDSICVTYRARLAGDYLIVEAKHEEPWHTYSLDNEVLAKEKLAGKMALGIDQPTVIRAKEGLEIAGPWLHTPPEDISKPELRIFAWGYSHTALLAAKAKRTGTGPATIGIRGQACSATTCKNVNLTLTLPAEAGPAPDLKALAPARVAN
ncbi:MAG: hypothetical protein R2729_32020 [Bryobacteraceae bacterium]